MPTLTCVEMRKTEVEKRCTRFQSFLGVDGCFKLSRVNIQHR